VKKSKIDLNLNTEEEDSDEGVINDDELNENEAC
jgi:hypothetical protein